MKTIIDWVLRPNAAKILFLQIILCELTFLCHYAIISKTALPPATMKGQVMYEPTSPPILERKNAVLPNLKIDFKHVAKVIDSGNDDVEIAHIHNCYEIFFNDTTPVSFLVNNKLYPVAMGDVILSGVNDVHVCIFHTACKHSYFCLWIEAEPETPIAKALDQASKMPHLTFNRDTASALRTLFFRLKRLYGKKDRDIETAATLLQILSLFDARKSENARTATVPAQLQDILDDVNERFAEIHHVNDISDVHFVSTATLNRWFKRYLHISPREFLESKKLSYAASLLSAGESVTDACTHAGFAECSHFIRRFKMKFGVTPLKYRQNFEE